MKARRVIESSLYEPQTLEVLFRAFDDAWSEIADHFGNEPRSVQEARARLAHACLIVSHEDSDDADQIRRDALQVMALAYRPRS